MFRFTIRDVLWAMVVVSLILLWASERKWRSFDWPQVLQNEGRLHNRIAEQQAEIKKLNARFVAEQDLRLEIERRLAEAEATTPNSI
jgi:hypothetical protein